MPLLLLRLPPNFSTSAALEIWPYDNKWEEFKTKMNYPETKKLKYLLMERLAKTMKSHQVEKCHQ